MKYNIGDLVYFETVGLRGVGKILDYRDSGMGEYLVSSTQLPKEIYPNRRWIEKTRLVPFEKKVGQKYKALVGHWPFEVR